MKAGWEEVTLGDLCQIARGGSPRPIKAFITEHPDGINWIKIGDTKAGGRYIDHTAEKIIPEGAKRSRFVEPGAFLLSNSMSFGRPYIVRTSGCIHDGWLVLEPDYKRVDQAYLYYVLIAPQTFAQFDAAAAGSTVRNLNTTLASTVTIPLPPLEEQQRIVAILDEAFEGLARAKANAEANLASAKELFEAALGEAFSPPDAVKAGWEIREIGEAFHTVTGNTPPKSAKHYYGYDVPLVKPPELTDGDVACASDGLSNSGALVARVAPAGSVLVSCIGNLGKIGIATRPVAFNQQINAIYPDSTLALPRFTFYQTLSPQFRGQLDALAAGTTVSIVNKSRFNSIKVPLPPLEEQQRIVGRLDQMKEHKSDLERNYTETLANLDQLRQSLLAKAFAGELS